MNMRKYLLTALLLMATLYGFAQSQYAYVEIGAFMSAGTAKTAHAYLTPDSSTVYGYVIPAQFTSPFKLDNPVVNIYYTDSLMTRLKIVSSKYRECLVGGIVRQSVLLGHQIYPAFHACSHQ
jgi:hypothetical protein